jgi:hypothetical protein
MTRIQRHKLISELFQKYSWISQPKINENNCAFFKSKLTKSTVESSPIITCITCYMRVEYPKIVMVFGLLFSSLYGSILSPNFSSYLIRYLELGVVLYLL